MFKDKQEFKRFFDSYYPSLCSFATKIVGDVAIAEDMVQDVFLTLWEISGDFSNEPSIRSFLYTSVKNRCLNYLEHTKVINKHDENYKNTILSSTKIDETIIEEETHRLIYNAIDQLPDQCKTVLLMSINGLKNKEIAEELKISENTVKTQKKIAYKQLKIKLKDIYAVVGLLFGNVV